MGTCSSCGTKDPMLFETDTGPLCWLCSSRNKAEAVASRDKSLKKKKPSFSEKRACERYPVHIHAKLVYGTTEATKVIFPGTAINLSEGGLCMEWTPCEECQGYLAGEIHPDCIFYPYSMQKKDSDTFYVSIFLAENDVLNMNVKAVFIIKKQEDMEYIGVSFIETDANTVKRIRDIINKVQNNG